jgi:hypothetical protein
MNTVHNRMSHLNDAHTKSEPTSATNNTNGHRLTWKSDNTGDLSQATNEQMISNADDYSGYEESPEAAFESYTIRAQGSRCETLLWCRGR